MARKPNDRRRLDAKKRRLKRLQRKGQGGLPGGESLSLGPFGMEKMSEVLEEFVGPFIPEMREIDEIRTLFSFGMMAWNTALLPEPEQEEAIEDFLRKIRPSIGGDLDQFRTFLNQLILRKNMHFARNRRMIAGFDVIDNGRSYQLNVLSSFEPPD